MCTLRADSVSLSDFVEWCERLCTTKPILLNKQKIMKHKKLLSKRLQLFKRIIYFRVYSQFFTKTPINMN